MIKNKHKNTTSAINKRMVIEPFLPSQSTLEWFNSLHYIFLQIHIRQLSPSPRTIFQTTQSLWYLNHGSKVYNLIKNLDPIWY